MLSASQRILWRSSAPTIPAANGGSTGYSVEHRNDSIAAHGAGLQDLNTPRDRSIRRWTSNGTARLKQTGNADLQNLRGEHMYLLATFRYAFPKGTADEAIAFIATYSTNPRLYSWADITLGEQALGFTRKKSSTAYQAFTPQNMHRSQLYWNTAHPTGEPWNVLNPHLNARYAL